MLGESPVDPARLIGKERFAAHSLTPAAFEQRIGARAIVLDIRDQYQQEGTALFPAVQTSVPLDNKALKRYVEQARRENKTLLIYDAGGQQVRWLQYYLEAEHEHRPVGSESIESVVTSRSIDSDPTGPLVPGARTTGSGRGCCGVLRRR